MADQLAEVRQRARHILETYKVSTGWVTGAAAVEDARAILKALGEDAQLDADQRIRLEYLRQEMYRSIEDLRVEDLSMNRLRSRVRRRRGGFPKWLQDDSDDVSSKLLVWNFVMGGKFAIPEWDFESLDAVKT